MKNKLFWLFIFSLYLGSCGYKAENEQLKAQLDSARMELELNQRIATTFEEVATLMDSIDANRSNLRLDMVEGTTRDDYVARMEDLNEYVKETENRLAELEGALAESDRVKRSFAGSINKLKRDLAKRNEEIAVLQQQVDKYQEENKNLITIVELQEAEIEDKQLMIDAKLQELALIEARIAQLKEDFKISEADAYFAQAEAFEEAARRTKLAPKKRKNTYMQALELYEKALDMGRKDAQAKIEDIKKRV